MPLGLDVTGYLGHQSLGNRLSRIVKSLINQGNQPFSIVRFEKIQVLFQLLVGGRLVREEATYDAGVFHDAAGARFDGAERAVSFGRATPLVFRQPRTDGL